MKLALAVAALSLIGAAPAKAPVAYTNGFFIPLDLVKKLECSGGGQSVSGSGAYIDGDLILTAAHVAQGRTCTVDGMLTETVHVDGDLDIAVIKTQFPGRGRISISCKTPRSGDEIYAVGFARGEDFVVQRYWATGTSVTRRDHEFGGLSMFKGIAYPGMSGGPVLDERGQMVGILNAGNPSGLMMGRLLSDTYLCRA